MIWGKKINNTYYATWTSMLLILSDIMQNYLHLKQNKENCGIIKNVFNWVPYSSYKDQSTNIQCKQVNWFLYNKCLSPKFQKHLLNVDLTLSTFAINCILHSRFAGNSMFVFE